MAKNDEKSGRQKDGGLMGLKMRAKWAKKVENNYFLFCLREGRVIDDIICK